MVFRMIESEKANGAASAVEIIGEGMACNYLEQELSEGSLPDSKAGRTVWLLPEGDNPEEWVRGALAGIEKVPDSMVFMSSIEVYGPDAGEGIDETHPTVAASELGRSYARAEMAVERWASERGVKLAVARMAEMFGSGVKGKMQELFARVISGRYVHIRGNEAKMSAVTALDAARAMKALAGKEGIYNVSDGRAHLWLDLAESMSANAGARRRMTHLPAPWAEWIYRLFGRLPIVAQMIGPKVLEPVSRTLVVNNEKVCRATGMEFFDTLAVIAREAPNYPYQQK